MSTRGLDEEKSMNDGFQREKADERQRSDEKVNKKKMG
jgi:hypothetical protein